MTFDFIVTTRIASPVESMFDLSLSIDAHLGSMKDSRERAIAGVTSGRIGLGQEVTWRARHFGFRWTMTSRIAEYERPHWFVDEQARGPFARFRHEHRFEALDGTTLMTDHVTFDAPLGSLGRVAERAVLGRYLRRLIEQRNQYLRECSETPSTS